MISLTFAQIHLDNVTATGNFAELSANGFSLIRSHAWISNSYLDNSDNQIGMDEQTIAGVAAGFVNMNY
jgi:hypothetical protein